MWQHRWVHYQPFIHYLYKKQKCILLSHFHLSATQKTPSRNLSGNFDLKIPTVRVWEQASIPCVQSRSSEAVKWPRVQMPWVTGRLLLLCSTELLLGADLSQPLLQWLTNTHTSRVWSTEAAPNSSEQLFQLPQSVSLQWFSSALSRKRAINLLKEIQTILHSALVLVLSQRSLFTTQHKLGCSESSLVPSISSPRFFLPCTQKVSGTGFTTLLRCSMNHHCCVGSRLKNTTPENSVCSELQPAEGTEIPSAACRARDHTTADQ